MKDNSLISIVIPHFNRVELLQETLNSIKTQQYKNWEVLVVDDGSTKEQWTALQSLASEKVRILQRIDGQKGPSRCRNLAVKESVGSYLIFVDSDDILAPWCLSQRVQATRERPDLDLWVFSVLLFTQKVGDSDRYWNSMTGKNDLERFLSADSPWHTSSPLWRKATFTRIGGFNENVFYGDDSDLHVRALLNSVHYKKFEEFLPDVFIRRSEKQRITNTQLQALIESRKIRLVEGTRLLRRFNASPEMRDIWEGQYFVEGEELLFSEEGLIHEICGIVDAWIQLYQPSVMRRQIVRSYFFASGLVRQKAYLLLRIFRRIAKLVLPSSYFPNPESFPGNQLSDSEKERLERALSIGRL